MQNYCKKCYDIEGLDLIGACPLAVGWWLIICFAIVLLIAMLWLYWCNKKYKASWSYPLYLRLIKLENNLQQNSKKDLINELSECLRKVAIKKYPREACASISGQVWLNWFKRT